MPLPPETVARLLEEGKTHRCPGSPDTCVKIVAVAELPSRFGEFQVVAFWSDHDRQDHAAFVHGDIVVITEQPKLAGYIDQMREKLAGALVAGHSSVSVKAKTNEGMGFIDRGEGIAAIAVVLLE